MAIVVPFLGGIATSLAVAPPAEWYIHKNLMHVPKSKRRGLSVKASGSHQDNHHMAFRGPEHYYSDLTNEHAILTFGSGYVALIAGISAGVGASISAGYEALKSTLGNETPLLDPAYVAGFVVGTIGYQQMYEFVHYNFHVIGERRRFINNELGEILQGKEGDGKLRFSKPLLDDICNETENRIDSDFPRLNPCPFSDDIYARLQEQLDANPQSASYLPDSEDPEDILEQLQIRIFERELDVRKAMGFWEKQRYRLKRTVMKALRNFSVFEKLDNHHFLHHYHWLKNLNVVCPIADMAFGTKVDSSREALENNTHLWLCPNSPDKEPFIQPWG